MLSRLICQGGGEGEGWQLLAGELMGQRFHTQVGKYFFVYADAQIYTFTEVKIIEYWAYCRCNE